MMKDKKWQILHEVKSESTQRKITDLLTMLLSNRGINTPEEIKAFLHPNLEEIIPENVGLDSQQVEKALARLQKAFQEKEQIVIFGDYDVDGITGTAILWETLHGLGFQVMPYIPHRIDEGYGLSIQGIENIQNQTPNLKLIITVDNGITATKAVAFAKEKGIDVIITDHHLPPEGGEKTLPAAHAIVHTTKLCGAGVAYLLAQEISNETQNNKPQKANKYLDLVALGTIADLVPLTGANRTLVKYGLEALRKTTRPGLLALFQEAKIDVNTIDVYHVGHIIAPRLNAMGRLENAMDSLRLVCTNDPKRASTLAEKLGTTNRQRQVMTMRMADHAVEKVMERPDQIPNILFVYDELYEPGIIGLIAGRLVERFYRPAIVLSKGEKISKASARSITGFNIIELLRSQSHLLLDHGGHPMAAGFSVETEKLVLLQEALEKMALEQITEAMLIKIIKVDCELPIEWIDQQLFDSLKNLTPFGMTNPEPLFVSRNIMVRDIKAIGMEGRHLKMKVGNIINFDAIAFGMGELTNEIKLGDMIDIVYTIDENMWNGKTSLQLKVRDIKKVG